MAISLYLIPPKPSPIIFKEIAIKYYGLRFISSQPSRAILHTSTKIPKPIWPFLAKHMPGHYIHFKGRILLSQFTFSHGCHKLNYGADVPAAINVAVAWVAFLYVLSALRVVSVNSPQSLSKIFISSWITQKRKISRTMNFRLPQQMRGLIGKKFTFIDKIK